MARRKTADPSGPIGRQLAETRELIELSERIVALAKFEETTSAALVRRSRSAIADTLRRFDLGGVKFATMARESRRQMAIRHVAEQERRVAKQRLLVARLADHGLPTEQAEALLAQMIDMLEDMRGELHHLSMS